MRRIELRTDTQGGVYLGLTLDAHTLVFISEAEAADLQRNLSYTLSELRKCDV